MLVPTSTQRRKLELQLVAFGYEKPNSEGRWTGKIVDMGPILDLVKVFVPELRLAWSKAEFAWKWRLGETPDLPAWSCADGRILLLGDSAHG